MDLTVNSKDFGNDLARLNMLYNAYGIIQEKRSQPTTKTAKQNALALFGEAKKHKAVVAKKSIFGNKYNCQKDDSDIIAKNLFGFSDVVAFDMIKENGVFVGATVYHKVAKVVGYIGKARKPMFRHSVKRDTVYFCKYNAKIA